MVGAEVRERHKDKVVLFVLTTEIVNEKATVIEEVAVPVVRRF